MLLSQYRRESGDDLGVLRGNVTRLGRIRGKVVEFDRARHLVYRDRTWVEVNPDRLPVAW